MKSRLLTTTFCLITALALGADGKSDSAADPAIKTAIQKVEASGASLLPIAADVAEYRFTALNVAKQFKDDGLAPLAPIADKITSLDLARTSVTDAGLKAVSAMKNLKELRLDNTGITDAGLDQLKGLTKLEYLNLYGTKVTDAGVIKLAALPALKSLYLWQTGVTKKGFAQLKGKMPKTHINMGWGPEDDAKPVAVVAAAKPAAPAPAPTKPAAAAAAKPAAAKLDAEIAKKANVYQHIIAPILEAKCVACHGEDKTKGKLKMHTFADLLKGGSEGDVTVIPKNTKDSLMLVRAKLPLDDDEHMPPEDEEQLTAGESALLEWWVAEGASDKVSVADAKKTPAIETLLAAALSSGLPKVASAKPKEDEKPAAAPMTDAEKKALADVTAKLAALNATLMPIAQDTELLRLSVINAADKFGDKELALLSPVAKHIVWLDLARSKVTDAGLASAAAMTNLERLHLENTSITDAGVAKLAGLKNLEYLNLYATKVTDAGIAKLATATGLRKLFVWQTGVTKAGAKALEGKIAGLVVNVGLSEAEIAKLTAPPPAPPKKEEAKPAPAPAKKPEPAKKADTPPAKKAEPKKADTPPAKKAGPKKADATPAKKPDAVKKPAPKKPAAAPAQKTDTAKPQAK